MKDKLLDVGAQMGMRIGIANITRRGLAAKAKVSEALVSHHLGNREALHKALKRHMKKHGYVEPSAERIAAEGKRLRAKKNPAPARKHSAKEVEAMKRKGVPKKAAAKKALAKFAPRAHDEEHPNKGAKKVIARPVEKVTRPLVGKGGTAASRKRKRIATVIDVVDANIGPVKTPTAARAPKLPPPLPMLPVIPPPLPRIEDMLEKK